MKFHDRAMVVVARMLRFDETFRMRDDTEFMLGFNEARVPLYRQSPGTAHCGRVLLCERTGSLERGLRDVAVLVALEQSAASCGWLISLATDNTIRNWEDLWSC